MNDLDARIAGPIWRVGAWLIDSVVFVVPGVVIATSASRRVQLVSSVVVVAVYRVGMVAWRGQTIGKIVLRMKVVDSRTGEKPSFVQAIIRWFVPALTGLLLFVSTKLFLAEVTELALYTPVFATPKRQGIHDAAARTLVVRI